MNIADFNRREESRYLREISGIYWLCAASLGVNVVELFIELMQLVLR